jgi:hypothetical protein
MGFPLVVIQTLSAFVIFVAGYLLLFVMIVCVLALVACVYKGGCLAKAYTATHPMSRSQINRGF